MDKNHKITIPEPCHENWDEMTPKDNGRFCLSCTKTVIDFTQMLPEEMQHYFISNQNQSICGRFKKSQLDTITIQIPNRVLYSQTNYHKMFLLALFIAMGTTLFSCQDKDGKKQKIDKIEVVKEIPNKDAMFVGKSLINDTTLAPPPKNEKIKFINPISNRKSGNIKTYHSLKTDLKKNINNQTIKDLYLTGIVSSDNFPVISDSSKIRTIENNDVYIQDAIIEDTRYPDGIENLKKFIQKEYVFSKKTNIENGEIQASFVVEKDGSLSRIKLIKDLGNGSGEELIRVLKISKKWIPGMQNGKKTISLQYIALFVKNDTVKKSFLRTKIVPKIDTVDIKPYYNPKF